MTKLLFISMLLFSTNLFAGNKCSGVICNSDLKKLVVTANRDIYVEVNTSIKALRCTPLSGVFITLNKKMPGFEEIYSTLLTYKTLNKPIIIRVVEGSPNCQISYIEAI